MKIKAISIKRMLRNYQNGVGLDLGCGSGSMEKLIYNNFKEIIGVDPEPNQIKKAQEKNIPKCKFFVGDGISNNFKDKTFDFVILVNVLHHIHESRNILKILDNCYRILKEGGLLLIYEHNPFNPLVRLKFYYFSKVDYNCKMINLFVVRRYCKKIGFSKNKLRFIFSELFGEYFLVLKKS